MPDADSNGWDAFQTALAGLKSKLASAEQALEGMKGDVTRLEKSTTEAITQIKLGADRGVERVDSFFSLVQSDLNEMVGNVNDTSDSLAGLLEAELERLREVGEEFRDFLVDQTEEAWKAPVAAAAYAWQEDLEGVFEEQAQRFTEVEESVRSAVMEALASLEQFAKEELAEMVEEEAKETLDAAIARLRDEVLDGITTSQMQVQLTGFMAPILPQLMMVRVVASVIKKLLDIMRMGF